MRSGIERRRRVEGRRQGWSRGMIMRKRMWREIRKERRRGSSWSKKRRENRMNKKHSKWRTLNRK